MTDQYSYPIVEWAQTIQGEFPHFGKPCTLIRLPECNLQCSYCDAQEVMGRPTTFLTENQILEKLQGSTQIREILLTGGEPLLYDVNPLIELLYRKGYQVVVETNGTQDLDLLTSKCTVAMDVKLTDEGLELWDMAAHNLKFLAHEDIVKFVLTSHHDEELAQSFIEAYYHWPTTFETVISHTPDFTPNVSQWLQFQERYPLLHLRFQTQLHKAWGVA